MKLYSLEEFQNTFNINRMLFQYAIDRRLIPYRKLNYKYFIWYNEYVDTILERYENGQNMSDLQKVKNDYGELLLTYSDCKIYNDKDVTGKILVLTDIDNTLPFDTLDEAKDFLGIYNVRNIKTFNVKFNDEEITLLLSIIPHTLKFTDIRTKLLRLLYKTNKGNLNGTEDIKKGENSSRKD